MVEIPGFDAPGGTRAYGGVRTPRSTDGGAVRRSDADTPVVEGDQPELSAVGRRHLSEGAARLHDVAAFAPITDADNARATARDLVRSLREQPAQAEAAQAQISAAAVQRLLQG